MVASLLGLNRSSVLRWGYPEARGGTGGRIPSKHQMQLMALAPQLGVCLQPSDFFASDLAA